MDYGSSIPKSNMNSIKTGTHHKLRLNRNIWAREPDVEVRGINDVADVSDHTGTHKSLGVELAKPSDGGQMHESDAAWTVRVQESQGTSLQAAASKDRQCGVLSSSPLDLLVVEQHELADAGNEEVHAWQGFAAFASGCDPLQASVVHHTWTETHVRDARH
jgi:hypothetical protein